MEFAAYVAQQRPALMRFATVLTGRPWLADDLVSDALGRAYERWDRIGELAQPHAYVRRMIVNDYVSWHRRLARTRPQAEIELPTCAVGDGAEAHAERDAMSDLHTLDDAFAELERRADTFLAAHADDQPLATRIGRRGGVLLAAAVVIGVGAVAVMAAVLRHPGRQSGAGTTTGSSAHRFVLPRSSAALEQRFRRVLGGEAEFQPSSTPLGSAAAVRAGHLRWLPVDVHLQGGVGLRGALAASGMSGSAELEVGPSAKGDVARCDGTPPKTPCQARAFGDGSTLAITELPAAADVPVIYTVDLVRADGVEIRLRLSNRTEPDGALSPRPPPTTDQMVAIVTSDRW